MTMNSESWWEEHGTKLDAAHHKYIFVHHTDGPAVQTVDEIDQEHKAKGWAGIGYNRVVYHDGTIHPGRPDDIMGAQALGENAWSIGVAMTGCFTTSLPPKTHWDGLVHCLAVECARWSIDIAYIRGHRDAAVLAHDPSDATSCLGDAMYAQMDRLRAEVTNAMAAL